MVLATGILYSEAQAIAFNGSSACAHQPHLPYTYNLPRLKADVQAVTRIHEQRNPPLAWAMCLVSTMRVI